MSNLSDRAAGWMERAEPLGYREDRTRRRAMTVDRIRADAVFWLGQLFPQDVSKVAGDFFDYVVASLKTLPPSELAELFGARPCADGTFVHDFKGQQSCPACGMEGIRA